VERVERGEQLPGGSCGVGTARAIRLNEDRYENG
jgi:hypothetical protein